MRQAKKRLKTVSSTVETLMIVLLKIFGDCRVLFFDIADALSYTAEIGKLPPDAGDRWHFELEWLEAFLTIESDSRTFYLSQVKRSIQRQNRRLIYRIK